MRVPDGRWIPNDREGLTLIDATSAIFAQPIDWAKADVVTYSWQKVLGGEGAHGMLILSPRAVARLESHVPSWPMPKLFRLTKGGKLDATIFEGDTINTPSMLCVEDYLDALAWAESVGGLAGLMARADRNARVLFDWIGRTAWVENLARDEATRSNTSVCLRIVDPAVLALPDAAQAAFAKVIAQKLETEGVALDIGSYRDAPAGLRIWTGATVESADLEALTPVARLGLRRRQGRVDRLDRGVSSRIARSLFCSVCAERNGCSCVLWRMQDNSGPLAVLPC